MISVPGAEVAGALGSKTGLRILKGGLELSASIGLTASSHGVVSTAGLGAVRELPRLEFVVASPRASNGATGIPSAPILPNTDVLGSNTGLRPRALDGDIPTVCDVSGSP